MGWGWLVCLSSPSIPQCYTVSINAMCASLSQACCCGQYVVRGAWQSLLGYQYRRSFHSHADSAATAFIQYEILKDCSAVTSRAVDSIFLSLSGRESGYYCVASLGKKLLWFPKTAAQQTLKLKNGRKWCICLGTIFSGRLIQIFYRSGNSVLFWSCGVKCRWRWGVEGWSAEPKKKKPFHFTNLQVVWFGGLCCSTSVTPDCLTWNDRKSTLYIISYITERWYFHHSNYNSREAEEHFTYTEPRLCYS